MTLREMLSTFIIEYKVSCVFMYGLYYIEVFSLLFPFSGIFFIINRWHDFSKTFSASNKMIMISPFSCVNVMYHID